MHVADVMTGDVRTVYPETSLKEAAQVMLEGGVSGLPVVDGAGTLVGIITEADFLEAEAGHSWDRPRRLLDGLFGRGQEVVSNASTVGEIMSTELRTIDADATLSAAARVMLKWKVKRLPVVDGAGKLVGIVSRADVIKAFARDDAAIAADIGDLLERQVIPVEPGEVKVYVQDGRVSLGGLIENQTDAALLTEVVRHIDGVVSVDANFTLEVDERLPEEKWGAFSQEGADR